MRNGILDNLNQSYTNISLENISVQKDVQIIKTLDDYFSSIIDIIVDKKIKNGRALQNRQIRVLFARIDDAISKRIQFNLKSVEDPDGMIGVRTTPPNSFNVLAGDVKLMYGNMQAWVTAANDRSNDDVDIDTKTVKWTLLLKNYLQSVDAIDRKLETSNMVIDLENAKIHGYPDKSFVAVVINPVFLISELKLTAQELTAVFIHEVGHAFSHIEYAYRSVRNTTTLIESLLKHVSNNKPPLEAIKLSYYDTFQDDDIADTTSPITASIGVTSKYIVEARDFGGNTNAGKDSERVADQFAARFGVGGALATGLDKMSSHQDTIIRTTIVDFGLVLLRIYLIGIVIGVLLPGISILVMMAITGAAIGLGIGLIMMFIMYTLITTLTTVVDKIDKYDGPKRRVLNIKNELVRQLRDSDATKEETKIMLATIDSIVSISNGLDAIEEPKIYTILGKLFKYKDAQDEMKKLDQIIDDLMNNDIHVVASKLKTL